ncbi:hypothetical protein [Thalassoroseus pseudoceratinae]|uniref:hypothetical protein n=1 Tax=Thalassoroseus pseudoceratinae TaxID=2713176 RepID=UPI001420C398|nr:hypothetical protein [Thalassoroseus pseudoceratinae]
MISDFLDGQTLFAFGVVLLTVTMMRMSIRRRKGLHKTPETSISAKEVAPVQAASERLDELEVRLHDFDREITGRVETTLALLDRLIEEADHEIVRLETLLEKTLPSNRSGVESTPRDREVVRQLRTAGYGVQEIAELTGLSIVEVARLFDGRDDDEARRAA